jgi:glutaredoxin
MATVTLYGKAGCCLCDEARADLLRLRERHGFALEEVDVSLDPRLARDYGERIPVVAVDGAEACELGLDVAEIERLLAKVAAS